MNLIKQITNWRNYELPSLSQGQTIPLVTAYACMSCRRVQDGAKHGACDTCGSKNIRSVSDAFDWMSNRIHKSLEEAKARKRARTQRPRGDDEARRSVRSAPTQEPQSLTEFRR